MMQSVEEFFDYCCDRCGNMFCERVHIMNMALGYVDEEYCLPCLSAEHEQTEADMAGFAWGYVKERDCFKNPWEAFDASACPKKAANACYCQQGA